MSNSVDFFNAFVLSLIMRTNSVKAAENSEITTLKSRVKELEILVKYYEEQLKLKQKKQFGQSSEKSCYDQISLDIFNEPEATATELTEKAETTAVKGHVRRKIQFVEKFPEDVPVTEIVIELPEEERVCPDCGDDMAAIGREEARKEYVLIPAKVELRKYITCTYACKRCEKENIRVPIKKSASPPAVINGSNASPEAIAYMAYQKYTMGVPLYRQEQDWARQGVLLSRQTMANCLIRCANDWLLPIWLELKRRMLEGDVLHADETTIQVLKEPGKTPQSKSCMWQYRTGETALEPIVLFEYKPDKKAANPAAFLSGWSGYLHTDGNESYHKLHDGVISVGCWAHARRRFDEAVKVISPDDREGSDAMKGKKYCDKLFEIERELVSLTEGERYKERINRLKPVMDEFFAWLPTVSARPKSRLGIAIGYALSQQKYLRNVLLDGRLSLSNNLSERTIKSFVICRKNFLFANTPNGATASAVIFSLIETAKAEGLNPYDYLAYVFRMAPGQDMQNEGSVHSLLPSVFKKTITA
jgi:transposase